MTYENGKLTWEDGVESLVIGQGRMFEKWRLSSPSAKVRRLDIARGLFNEDFVHLDLKDGHSQTLTLVNKHEKRTVFIKGPGLSSTLSVGPGEGRLVQRGQTLIIGPHEVEIEFP